MTTALSTTRFEVQTRSADQTLSMERDHASLAPEQDKREPLVNSIEHGAGSNNGQGRVHLNWAHWHIQQKYRLYCQAGAPLAHARKATAVKMRGVYAMSVASKCSHRQREVSTSTFTPEEIEIALNPVALTLALLGIWDHEAKLVAALKTLGPIGVKDDEDAA